MISRNNFSSFLLTLFVLFFLISCSGHSVYLIPRGNSEGGIKPGEKLDVQIRPIYTSDYQSEDRENYFFDFSSFFTAIEIRFHNGTPDQMEWNPDQTFLKYGENKEYKVLNEEEVFRYYKKGDLEGNPIILLDKPYEQQKEDIENIKRFMIKPVVLASGGNASGLLLFKKVPLNGCENVQLIVGGIQINQQEKMVKFPLECPKE